MATYGYSDNVYDDIKARWAGGVWDGGPLTPLCRRAVRATVCGGAHPGSHAVIPSRLRAARSLAARNPPTAPLPRHVLRFRRFALPASRPLLTLSLSIPCAITARFFSAVRSGPGVHVCRFRVPHDDLKRVNTIIGQYAVVNRVEYFTKLGHCDIYVDCVPSAVRQLVARVEEETAGRSDFEDLTEAGKPRPSAARSPVVARDSSAASARRLCRAARMGDMEAVRALVEEAGVSVQAAQEDGATALHHAAQVAHVPVVEVRHGACPAMPPPLPPPPPLGSRAACCLAARAVPAGARSKQDCPGWLWSHARGCRHEQRCRSRGSRTARGASNRALRAADHGAVCCRQAGCAACPHRQRVAPPHSPLSLPLRAAHCAGDELRVRYLLSRGQDVDERNPSGMTALHFAVLGRHYELCIALLEAGADPLIKNRVGKSALEASESVPFLYQLVRGRLRVRARCAAHSR